MEAKKRRERLLERLQQSDEPLKGTVLAKELGVSRQIIVGDMAILRAAGTHVYATPNGYVLPRPKPQGMIATLACRHTTGKMGEELEIMVDYGAKVLNVIVEHPVYGEIRANLMLASRQDVADFVEKLEASGAEPISIVTGGVHLHTIEIPTGEILQKIQAKLHEKGILLD